ncbi:hypothetical protein [Streptomyces vilmorinianum]|uniref:hypothetical protein n=1 Tax=Streptomyces vilmorinianum TaxID=3051092 RepID=UPI0010FBBE38|nr:hypothetical protein [Streptomyces vilmorinianum]
MGIPVTPPVPDYVPDFRPTHVVPRDGMPAWEAPDPGLPTAPLDAFLPVQLMERVGDWGQILCSNGWSAWVDARLLVSVPVDPPEARQSLARTADPRPLIARAEESLGRYRRAAEELAAGRTDGDGFRRRTHGLRVGMVVDGEALWLYDAEHERWVYCDGLTLRTYAASAGPSAASAVPEEEDAAGPEENAAGPVAVAGHEPTRVVPRLDEEEGRPKEPAGPPPTRVVDRTNLPGED